MNKCIIKMESNDKLKEIDIKKSYILIFDDIIEIEDFDLDNILIDEKSYENALVYSILWKILIDYKRLCIRFDRIDGFIRVYNGTRSLVLFGSEKYNSIDHKIRYLISLKIGFTYIISHNYATIKVDSYRSLPLEKTVTLKILVKSVWNKCFNNYYYNIFSEKASYELPKKQVFVSIIYYKKREQKNFKIIDIKDHTPYYFDYVMRVIDVYSRDILLGEKKRK